MVQFIILSGVDVLALQKNEPISIYIDGVKFTLCTDEYFERQRENKE